MTQFDVFVMNFNSNSAFARDFILFAGLAISATIALIALLYHAATGGPEGRADKARAKRRAAIRAEYDGRRAARFRAAAPPRNRAY